MVCGLVLVFCFGCGVVVQVVFDGWGGQVQVVLQLVQSGVQFFFDDGVVEGIVEYLLYGVVVLYVLGEQVVEVFGGWFDYFGVQQVVVVLCCVDVKSVVVDQYDVVVVLVGKVDVVGVEGVV